SYPSSRATTAPPTTAAATATATATATDVHFNHFNKSYRLSSPAHQLIPVYVLQHAIPRRKYGFTSEFHKTSRYLSTASEIRNQTTSNILNQIICVSSPSVLFQPISPQPSLTTYLLLFGPPSFSLLERPENHHMIRWDPAGEHIIVERPE